MKLGLLLSALAHAAPIPTVKLTPTLRIYECPAVVLLKSDCLSHEKNLGPVKIWLDLDVAGKSVGRWSRQESAPVPASFHVIVVRGSLNGKSEYSVSAEAGPSGAPMANARVEFDDATLPRSFGASSPPVEMNGKKYFFELRVDDFHGRIAN